MRGFGSKRGETPWPGRSKPGNSNPGRATTLLLSPDWALYIDHRLNYLAVSRLPLFTIHILGADILL